MLSVVTRLFPLWALLLSVLAYYTPATFTGIGPWVATLLMLIMFGMGVHLKIDDFKRVLSRPAPVAAGIFLHYLVMPLAAWLLAMAFKMPPDLSAGMVLVGSVASGTASNVMIYGERRRGALRHDLVRFDAGGRRCHTAVNPPVRGRAYSGGRDGHAAQHSADCGDPDCAGAGHSPSFPARGEGR